jgi:hypothetical protein
MKQVCLTKADNVIEWIFKGIKTSCRYKQGISVSSGTNNYQVTIYEAVIILQDFNSIKGIS